MSGVELTEFVLARISHDEDTARAAAVMPYAPLGWAEHVISAERDSTPSQDEHVLRHDPARVLAECEAKRGIVEVHQIVPGPAHHEDREVLGCDNCGWMDPIHGLGSGDPTMTEGPCATLRLLALPHAAHPDYREEWRP